MDEDEKKQPEAEGAVPPAATEPAPAETPAAPPAESKRDAFRKRIGSRYPDLDLDDEDAYYDRMGRTLDEYEGYEKNTKRLTDSLEKSPAMAEMLLAARDQDDFDPIVWLVRNKGLDVEAAISDPEYLDTVSKAHKEYLENEAKGKELYEEMKASLPGTLESQKKAMEEAGCGAQFDEVIGKIFQLADDISRGKWNPEVGVMLAKGMTRDADVETAREEGHAEGLSTKVDDRLRKLKKTEEYVGGRQAPAKPKDPKEEPKNMFMA